MFGVASNEELDAKLLKYRRQHKEDWDLFEKLVDSTGVRDKMFVTAGSKDVFMLRAAATTRGRFWETKMDIRCELLTSGSDTFRVVTLNPYQFPAASYRLTNWAFPTIELRRRLCGELVKPDAPITIVMAVWYLTYDTTRSMILMASQRTRFYLTGHGNHGNALEVVTFQSALCQS